MATFAYFVRFNKTALQNIYCMPDVSPAALSVKRPGCTRKLQSATVNGVFSNRLLMVVAPAGVEEEEVLFDQFHDFFFPDIRCRGVLRGRPGGTPFNIDRRISFLADRQPPPRSVAHMETGFASGSAPRIRLCDRIAAGAAP